MISVDNYLNETTRFAHVILPGPSPLQTPHFDEVLWGWAARSGANWSDPVFPPSPDRPDEAHIVARLGWLCTGGKNEDFDFESLDDAWFGALCRSQRLDAADIIPRYDGGGPERIIDLTVRTGPWGDRYGEVPDGLTLERIKAQPHGVDRGPMVPRVDEMVCTPDGLIDLAPDYIVGDLPRLRTRIAATDDDGFRLVSRRHLRSKNSWLHNVKVLVKGKDRCTLLVHPEDAHESGLVDGGRARVTSEAGTIEVPVEVSDEMMPGVVSLPHGWGHDRPGAQLSVAREHAGVNSNLLAPTHFYDTLSNNHAVNGIPVEVVPA
jgi:anaerobic selenocysteine-containing dehydrogenase